MSEKSHEYLLGYKQAQIDILRNILAGKDIYLDSDIKKLVRTVLDLPTASTTAPPDIAITLHALQAPVPRPTTFHSKASNDQSWIG